MCLEEQIKNFLATKDNKDSYISAKEFKDIFLLGFAKQMQIDIEQFFDFTLIDTKDGNCQIIAHLKKDNETVCHILNEFFLKENLQLVKNMFGAPSYASVENIGDGVAEIQNKQD